jgi:hypothetical protein
VNSLHSIIYKALQDDTRLFVVDLKEEKVSYHLAERTSALRRRIQHERGLMLIPDPEKE